MENCVEGETYWFAVKASRSVSGKTIYTPLSTSEGISYSFQEPSLEIVMDKNTQTNVKVIKLVITNKGDESLIINNLLNLFIDDVEQYEEGDTGIPLQLIDSSKYINNNQISVISSMEIPAHATKTVFFKVTKSGLTYSDFSAVAFLFEYDTKTYVCVANYYTTFTQNIL
jgi:hypothetical protein